MTKECVRSILENTKGVFYRIILVNDGSTEKVDDFYKYLDRFGNVIKTTFEHRGYIFAANDGLRMANAEYILLMNNDCVVSDPFWLKKMVDKFEDDTGAVGPTSNNVAGNQHVSFNDGRAVEEGVNYLIGFCLMFRKEVLDKVGLLDERFDGKASDDIDISIRIREAGYKLRIARDVFVEHKFSGSVTSDYQPGQEELKKKYGDEKCKKYLSPKPRLVIGIPTWGWFHSDFFVNFHGMKKPQGSVILTSVRGVVHLARNKIVQWFLEKGAEYLFFLDDDMICPQDMILRLLSYNKDIVCGMAFRRGEPYQPCAFTFNSDERLYIPIEPHQGLKEIDGAGSACILIHRRVFEKIGDPWYGFKEIFGKVDPPWYKWGEFGEDLMFCREAKLNGFKIYCDTDLICKHIGREMLVDDKVYLAYKKQQEEKDKKSGVTDNPVIQEVSEK